MAEAGYDFFCSQNQYKMIKQEVPFLSRCIDLVLVDEAYICLPERKISEELRKAICNAGLG